MYADLKAFANITYRDTARILLSPESDETGDSLRRRVDDRTFLSRNIVHAAPGRIPASRFSNFGTSAQTLMSRILSNRKDEPDNRSSIDAFLCGQSCDHMCAALEACGLDSNLYRNAIERITSSQLDSESNRRLLHLMLFIATGCLGDTAQALEEVEAFALSSFGTELPTMETTMGARYREQPSRDEGSELLGLLRIKDGVVCPPLHPLAPTPEGTVIGSIATSEHAITDVDSDVSREHLRIWKDADGWWAEGLGSTNGSSLVDGASRAMRTIEAPSTMRANGAAPDIEPRTRIGNGDTLYLGATTRFLVMSIAE